MRKIILYEHNISTVGKSLLSNASRQLDEENPDKQSLANFLRPTDEKLATAETNALNRLVKEGDNLIFLPSSTEEGRTCAEVLTSFYESKGFVTEEREVEDLDCRESKFKMQGLRYLV